VSSCRYIQWRFKDAEDKESLSKATMKLDAAAKDKLTGK